MKCYFLFCCLLLPIVCSAVQSYTPTIADPFAESWRWRQEEALNGLGVLCMDEAGDGTLWFGNTGSIACYDGITIEKIPFDETFLSSISHEKELPWAKALLVLPDGGVLVLVGESLVHWSGSEWSVIIQDVGSSVFTPNLIRSDSGSIWLVVPEGLWRIDADLEHPVQVMVMSEENRLKSGCADSNGDIWLVENTEQGQPRLIQIPVRDGAPGDELTWKKVSIPVGKSFGDGQITADPNGLIWYVAGAKKSGLGVYDPREEAWLSKESLRGKHRGSSLLARADGSVLVGMTSRILHVFEWEEREISPPEEIGVPWVALSLFETQNGRLWVIGRIGYVYSVDLSSNEWMTYEELHFQCETDDGVQWFVLGRKDYVVSHDPHSGIWLEYGLEDGLMDSLRFLTASSHGLVWAGGGHKGHAAISVFNGSRWDLREHPDFATKVAYNAAFEESDGTMWFGSTGRMLDGVSHAGGALQYKVNPDRSVELVKHHSPPEFPYYVTAFAETSDQTLWLGSTTIRSMNSSASTKDFPELRGENCVAMVLDHQQNLWVAKEHFGVCQWTGHSWRVFNTEDGLADLLLCDLISLSDGSLLVSSSQGISRFDGNTWMHAYPESFAMAHRRGGLRESSDGSLWLNNHQVNRLPYPYYTIRHRAEKGPPDTTFVHYLEKVSQPGNTLITWAGQDPWSSTPYDELQYSWRLNRGDWSAFSQDTSHTFLDLESGRYVLEVRSRDRAFNIDSTPASIEFVVIPPVWKQAWFIALVLSFSAVIVTLVWVLIHIREERQKEREALLVKQQEEREEYLIKQREQRERQFRKEQTQLVERQQEREDHLKEVDRIKTGFFTNISHELRTPLTVIAGRLEAIFKEETDEKRKTSLSAVLRNTQRVSMLITQLLDFRKLEEGKIQVEAARGDLVAPFRDWVSSLEVLAEKKNILLTLECAEICNGWFDFDKVQKIVTNLISNSIKYTAKGGEVRIELNVNADAPVCQLVQLVVEDTGLGISPENLEHIFDRFYRVSEATMAVGAGIGLNLTKELVDLLGGEIKAESPIGEDAERPGTRFTVWLPVHSALPEGVLDAEAPVVREVSSVVSEGLHTSNRSSTIDEPSADKKDASLILIVEDDEDIRSFLAEGLGSIYRVGTAENGEVGLQKAKELVPDLVVTDLMMPVMDGVAMCRELKVSLETSHIPVVMLTAKTALDSQIEGLKTGADDYVTKPFHMELLQVRITNLLESRRLLREKFCKENPVIASKVPENSPDKEFLEKTMQVLEENYSDWGFKPEQFAAALFMSLSSLRRKLRAVVDRAPQAFIYEFRMQRAAELLIHTSHSVTDITFMVGLEEPTNFTRLFKKFYKMSPSKYRKEHQPS